MAFIEHQTEHRQLPRAFGGKRLLYAHSSVVCRTHDYVTTCYVRSPARGSPRMAVHCTLLFSTCIVRRLLNATMHTMIVQPRRRKETCKVFLSTKPLVTIVRTPVWGVSACDRTDRDPTRFAITPRFEPAIAYSTHTIKKTGNRKQTKNVITTVVKQNGTGSVCFR